MTPLLSTNMKIDPVGQHISGSEFVVVSTSEEVRNRFVEAWKAYRKVSGTSTGKPWIKNIQFAAFGIYLGMFVAYLILLENRIWETPFKSVYFAALFILIAVSFGLSILNQHFKKKSPLTEDVKKKKEEMMAAFEEAKAEQGVNAPTDVADIFCFAYEQKENSDGETETDLLWCRNVDMTFYSDDEFLYVCNFQHKYALPRKAFLGIRKVRERTNLMCWNKEFSHKGEEAKAMGVKTRDGALTVDYYCVLELQGRDRVWGLCFPPYELAVFEKLSNLKAEE